MQSQGHPCRAGSAAAACVQPPPAAAVFSPASPPLLAPAQLYALFGKYGAIRQIRLGSNKETRGTAYVVYEDIFDAKTAVDHLSGFNVQVGAAQIFCCPLLTSPLVLSTRVAGSTACMRLRC